MSKNRKPEKPVASRSTPFTRRRVLFALGAVAVAGVGGSFFLTPSPTMAEGVVVYKDPSCVCCGRWVDHMRQSGFAVDVINVEDMEPVKRRAGVPEPMESCHTAHVGGYIVEGHVPAEDVRRMLAERPAIKGLTVPGMPMSAPGMDSPEREPYTVLSFNDNGSTGHFASH